MATREPPGDPRAVPLGPAEADIRPVVAVPGSGLPGWAILVFAIAAGVILFVILDARRRAPTAPDVRVQASDAAGARTPPPLYVPQQPPPAVIQAPTAVPAPAPAPAAPRAVPPQIIYVPQPMPSAAPEAPPPPPPPPARTSTEPALVVDLGAGAAAGGAEGEAGAAGAAAAAPGGISGARARPGRFANPSTTVVQGTLIPAVLETALDSTRPGLARAIVSRNIRGFDGSRLLIPRGSRLIGEYRSDVAQGQRRALVTWVRLIRPDGVTIAIGSPASDRLGRVGIRAQVNSHFFARFAGAILQSVLDIGVNLAAGIGRGDTVVVLPGGVQQATPQVVQPGQVTPTMRVRQGTSISIFVARDLDFTRAANGR
ncbi:MAG TPA: TrbI/VirB10 family protein [Allosphingosinicella sp.]|nr:TrbI/VirB10 family protein [Allosphingosinicella sp.]